MRRLPALLAGLPAHLVLVFFQHRHADPGRPLALALQERVRRLARAFAAVILAQVEISAVNAALVLTPPPSPRRSLPPAPRGGGGS